MENMKIVMSAYPGLVRVFDQKMEHIQGSNEGKPERLWAAEVADEIRGVPFPMQKTWMDNEKFKKWYERLGKPPSNVKKDCNLFRLAKETARRSIANRNRSSMLYEKKMENDMTPMRVVGCAVHANDEPCIPLGKLATVFVSNRLHWEYLQMCYVTDQIMLPDTQEFLTACEFQKKNLGNALGDELFLALHLIMRSCKDYMMHLKNYHAKQSQGLSDRSFTSLSELRMKELDDYEKVPSPEKIRDIVAECVTMNAGFCQVFIENIVVREKMYVASERDNRTVLKMVRRMKRNQGSANYAKSLRDILRMPASAVGACNCFHNSESLMGVAMRQFGIALLMVHEDAGVGNQWPYRTPDFLREFGSGVFLPITFGLIHVPESGNLSILRKCLPRGEVSPELAAGEEGCFSGYAQEMSADIRTESVNLLTGMFGLSYTAFADFICNPHNVGVTGKSVELPKHGDYRDPDYGDLLAYKRHWRNYQCELQDKLDEAEAKKHENRANSMGEGTGGCDGMRSQGPSASNMGQQNSAATSETPQEERDADTRFSLQSFHGKDDDKKKANREWYRDVYPTLFFSMPTEEELSGNAHTIELSLKLLGVTLRSEEDINDFFNNVKRGEMVKEKEKWAKRTLSKGVHPDKFKGKVANDTMVMENQHRCAALTTAVGALKEWDELALDEAKRDAEEEGRYKLQHLLTWEGEFYVDQWTCLDFTDFVQPTRKRKRKPKK